MSASRPDRHATHVADGPAGRMVTLESPHGRAVVHEYGAHVTSWTPARGGEALFVSALARLDGTAAIRGGVPVIFPQFANVGPLPKHGFARTMRWTLADAAVVDGRPTARLTLASDARTRATWPHDFAATLTVALDEALAITLAVRNTGDAPLAFTGALHTYLRVDDVRRARVGGLAERTYHDKLTDSTRQEDAGDVTLGAAMDRVYVDVPGPVRIHDDATGRTIRVDVVGFPDVVVWNPWSDGVRAFADLGDDEWPAMLCVEPAIAATPVGVRPGETWTGEQRLTVEG